MKHTGQVYAMKLLAKFEMVRFDITMTTALVQCEHLLFLRLIDQALRLSFLLGGERHYGSLRVRVDC